MRELERNLRGVQVVSRDMVLAAGGTDDMIATRVENGWWTRLHAGVYRIGPRSDDWLERLRSAVLAAGERALVSHRAAYVLWGLDGINTQLVEITVPYAHGPVPRAVIRHRTRRSIEGVDLGGIPTTPVERTLLDTAAYLPALVLAKGVDSALRLGLTEPLAIARTVSEQGGPGVRGVRKLERVVLELERSGPTGSPAELELLHWIRKSDLPEPVLQWEVVVAPQRRYRIDFGWPKRMKGVEVDGLDAHGSADKLERDLKRQNELLRAGVELRRFTGRQVRRNPKEVVAEIRRFLGPL